MTASRARARFPQTPAGAGHYESFYLRAGHPAQALAVWIRYTVLRRPGGPPRGTLWLTLFDPEAGPPVRVRSTADTAPSTGDDHYVAIGAARFEPGRVCGSAADERLAADWDLSFESSEPAFRHLPAAWMYRSRLPRTKLETLDPATTFSGTVTVAGRSLELHGWPGMVGHNWGSEHAERWVWLHGGGFEGHPDAWLDAVIGRVRVGRLLVPWTASGCLSVGGQRTRIGGVDGLAGTRVEAGESRCMFSFRAGSTRLSGTFGAPYEQFADWSYADPGGGERAVRNCSAAAAALTVERRGTPPLELRTGHDGVYEVGGPAAR